MGMCLEYLIDFRHVAAAASQNNTAHQLVRVLYRNLEPGVLYNFLNTSLYDFDKLLAFYVSVSIYLIVEGWVNITDVCICFGVFQFHVFSISLFYLQACKVLCNVAATQWDDRQVTEDTFIIYRDRCCVST